jgi:superfamily II DNA or RNA helicase
LGCDDETLTPDFYIVNTGFQFPFYNQRGSSDPVYHCKNFKIDISGKDKECQRDANSKCMYVAENGYQYRCKNKFTYDKNHTYLISKLSESKSRNTTIFKYLCYLHQKQQHILALFDRVASVKQFQESLSNIGIPAGILIGGSKKSENQSVIDSFKAEKIRIILGTKVADEGLDIPIIDTVMLCGPCAGHKGLLKQRIGRCVRTYKGKSKCRAIYFWDQVYQYHRKLLVSQYPQAKFIDSFTEIIT